MLTYCILRLRRAYLKRQMRGRRGRSSHLLFLPRCFQRTPLPLIRKTRISFMSRRQISSTRAKTAAHRGRCISCQPQGISVFSCCRPHPRTFYMRECENRFLLLSIEKQGTVIPYANIFPVAHYDCRCRG